MSRQPLNLLESIANAGKLPPGSKRARNAARLLKAIPHTEAQRIATHRQRRGDLLMPDILHSLETSTCPNCEDLVFLNTQPTSQPVNTPGRNTPSRYARGANTPRQRAG